MSMVTNAVRSVLDKVWYRNTITPYGDMIYARYANSSGVAVVYCHGAFGEGSPFDYSGVTKLADAGHKICLIRYGIGSIMDSDIKKVYAARAAFQAMGHRKVFLVGISRGGFVALTSIAFSPQESYAGVVICVAPTDLSEWIRTTSVPEPNKTSITAYFNWKHDLTLSSPVHYPESFRGINMLMVYGTKDEIVSPDQGSAFLTSVWDEKLDIRFLPGGHNLADDSMVQLLMSEWIKSIAESQW